MPNSEQQDAITMAFDEWARALDSGYRPSDDSVRLRTLRECWKAAQAAERERCARVCDDEARIRTEAGQQHPEGGEPRGRCFAAARAAINCARGVRGGEEV